MGDSEVILSGVMESPLGYHSSIAAVLTETRGSGLGTLSGGQFDWGGRLLKSNGGARRFSYPGWESGVKCKGKRELDCETNKSSRYESRS